MTEVRLAIPSKGRLQADTIAWFGRIGVDITPAEGGREYAGDVAGIDGVRLIMMSAGEVPGALVRGEIDLGLTGRDLVRETLPGWAETVEEIACPGFGYADLIIAVPAVWIDVDTIDDLDAAAAAFRASHGHRLRIATKYHALVRSFLTGHGVADYQLVDSQGATEGTIRNETAEAIADITSTGDTLRANHLKVLKDGLVLKSEAVLFGARSLAGDPAKNAVLATIRDRIAALPAD